MKTRRTRPVSGLLACLLLLLPALGAACATRQAPAFPVLTRTGEPAGVFGLSPAAVQGILSFARPEKLDYTLDRPLEVPAGYCLDIAYTLEPGAAGARYSIALEIAGSAYILPLDAAFLGIAGAGVRRFRYSVSVSVRTLTDFSITLRRGGEPARAAPAEAASAGAYVAEIAVSPPRYGFAFSGPALATLEAGAFVSAKTAAGSTAITITAPAGFPVTGPLEFDAVVDQTRDAAGAARKIAPAPEGIKVQTASVRFDYVPNLNPGPRRLYIPAGALPQFLPITLETTVFPVSCMLYRSRALGPLDPVVADPGIILRYPRAGWRDQRFEVFRWQDFPSILIMDTADYGVQDRFFKRLAFYVEKPGFRGRLAADSEIRDLHGWNAHDYNAESLAAFFETARQTGFPLLDEERELEDLLVRNGILRRGTTIEPGVGVVISISRDRTGSDGLREMLITHEGFHGLFFIDAAFRAFSRDRYKALSPVARRFLLAFLDYQTYDITDESLVINEFMAHVLQQSVYATAHYFGVTAAERVYSSPRRRADLPPMDQATKSWPQIGRAFEQETDELSEYTKARFFIRAGRIWSVAMTNLPK